MPKVNLTINLPSGVLRRINIRNLNIHPSEISKTLTREKLIEAMIMYTFDSIFEGDINRDDFIDYLFDYFSL